MRKTMRAIVGAALMSLHRLQFAWCRLRANLIQRRVKRQYPGGKNVFAVLSWPAVSGTDPGFTLKGKTTIMFGTNGLLSSPFPSAGFYTVIRCSQRPILERQKLPNGTGITSTDVFLQDGVTWNMVVRDDSQFDSNSTNPIVNTAVTVVDMQGLMGVQGKVYVARVVDPDYEANLKAPGERTLVIDNLVLIDSQSSASQTGR